MDEQNEMGAPASLEEVKQSVHSDLQYVSLEMDGRIYGGWYRVLADGRMELLALANMHNERRSERTPIEQARGMLANFVRAARSKSEANGSADGSASTSLNVPADEQRPDSAARTLGDLLYADKSNGRASEKDWVSLVQSIAAGDQLAVRALYERVHRVVFTLMVRLTHDRPLAEELTLDVFHEVWRRAPKYEVAGGPVVAWIMGHARSRAIDHLVSEEGKKRVNSHADRPSSMNVTVGAREVFDSTEHCRLLHHAVTGLAPDERQLIEVTYFSELGYAEVAAQLQQPPEIIRTQIHSGLEKLQQTLVHGSEGAMPSVLGRLRCDHAELVAAYALNALSPKEVSNVEAHISACSNCRLNLEALRQVIESFVFWPTDVLRPSEALWGRLAKRIAAETGLAPVLPVTRQWTDPRWEQVAPGISCKMLAIDAEHDRVSMLVRLAPGVDYPPHSHGGVEELHLLHGELQIDDRKLYPGDYNRAEAGSADKRVWSETGCTCVLITSTRDVIG